ncbi:hypothetical protein ABPG75_007490 [Micractinium tetrahymenae]
MRDVYCAFTCPILHLLRCSVMRMRTWGGDSSALGSAYRRTAAECMEILAAAAYRPHIYKAFRLTYNSPPVTDCNLLVHFPHIFDIDGINSWLWRAYTRPAWSPVSHHLEPAAFRAACRALLLAAHRGGAAQPPAGRGRRRMQARGGCAAGLACLPADVLLHIIGMAARPCYVWM